MKYNQYSFFFNDQWKASRRLTLTGGLRFEHMGNWVPNNNYGVAVWDPATYNNTSSAGAWTGLQWHSINSSIPSSGFPNKSFFVEPRFGFAYDIFGNGKTVVAVAPACSGSRLHTTTPAPVTTSRWAWNP